MSSEFQSEQGGAGAECPMGPVKVRIIEVSSDCEGQRLDNFLFSRLKGVPRTRVYRLIRKGEVRVNKKRRTADYRLQGGDQVRIPPVRMDQPGVTVKPGRALSRLIGASVLFEDDAMMVINKPAGLAVHGGSGIRLGLIEGLRQLRPECGYLELVHRLDRDTSGCILIAKKRSMLRALHALLRSGGVSKVYQALVDGSWSVVDTRIKAPLEKNVLLSGERVVRVAANGKPSLTRIRVLERFVDYTLVEVRPVTGRTHQIRVHCQYAGHSVVGDEKYGRPIPSRAKMAYNFSRMYLHASELRFSLPGDGGSMQFKAPLDQAFARTLDRLQATGKV
jgi:23S rRNA pseudouridine955/2504/2580 synthase